MRFSFTAHAMHPKSFVDHGFVCAVPFCVRLLDSLAHSFRIFKVRNDGLSPSANDNAKSVILLQVVAGISGCVFLPVQSLLCVIPI